MVRLHLLFTIFRHILMSVHTFFSNRTKAVLTKRRPRNVQQHRAASPTSMNDQAPGGSGASCIGEDAVVSCCFPTPSRERRWPPNIPHIFKAKGMQMPSCCGEQKQPSRRELYNSCIRFCCLLSVFSSSRAPSLSLKF